MARKKPVQFTPEVIEFIFDKMSDGNDVAQICTKWPTKVPYRRAIYRRTLDDADFAEKMNQAYTVLLMHRMDELHRLSNLTASEAFPNVEDWREAEATLKRQIDELKFLLGKMAPVLSKRFDKSQKVELSGQVEGSGYTVINYAAPAAIEKGVTVNAVDSDT